MQRKVTKDKEKNKVMENNEKTVKTLREEMPDFVLLVVLYLLQGVPLGLILGSLPFLLKAKLSYSDIAFFSLSSYPYSLKLLWSPIVDSIYFHSFGRRKSWIVPIQAIIGSFLLFLGFHIDSYISQDHIPITFLTFVFMFLVFLCATQDIAVDGWALTLLSDENKGYAASAQTIGLNSGYFLSFTVFLAFNSPEFCQKYLGAELELLTLSSYLKFWGLVYFVCNAWLIFIKKEEKEDTTSSLSEIYIVYKHIIQVCSMQHMWSFIGMLLISKIGFMANDSVTALKLLEKGFSKEDLALTVLIDFPFQIIFGYYAAKWSRGDEPLRPWLAAFFFRLGFGLFAMLLVHSVPKSGVTTSIFLIVVLSTLFNSFISTVMFVGMGSFFTKISDPRIGGTYMTLLNTLSNLGGTWPKYFVLKSVDFFSNSVCNSTALACNSEAEKSACSAVNGTCNVIEDGYYPVSIGCFIIGVVIFVFVVRPVALSAQKLSVDKWKVEEIDDEEIELLPGSAKTD